VAGHLFAYFGNEPDNLPCGLFPARNALYLRDAGRIEGWALGFVQSGDVLLQKRPRSEADEVDIYALARDLKADAFVARIGLGSDGNSAAEDADPFRYRSWLFGSVGSVPGFDKVRDTLLESVPGFLRRNIRGRSASEHVFHLFLSYLHDAGILDQPSPDTAQVKTALQGTLAFLNRLIATESAGATDGLGLELAMVATNGRSLIATTLGHPMQFLRVDGIVDCPVCQGRTHVEGDGRRISHDGLRAIVIGADNSGMGRSAWRPVPDRHALVIGPNRAPEVVPLAV